VRRSGDEYTQLVYRVVGWVKVTKVFEWWGRYRPPIWLIGAKEQRGGDALVDGIFGNVDKEEREHVGIKQLLSTPKVALEGVDETRS